MKKYIPIWVAALITFSAQAQEADDEINVVIFAPKAENAEISNRLPKCDNLRMLEQVSTQIQEYQENNPSDSIVGRREQALIVKNLKNFTEISIPDFNYKENYNVGKELVMTKVNNHLQDDEMRLCRNTGSNIYLLMYPEGNGARVQIINFVPSTSSGNDFSIYFENKKIDIPVQSSDSVPVSEPNNMQVQTE